MFSLCLTLAVMAVMVLKAEHAASTRAAVDMLTCPTRRISQSTVIACTSKDGSFISEEFEGSYTSSHSCHMLG